MKRLFVRPAFRNRGLGRGLVDSLITKACSAGYSNMVLDTLPWMAGALRLYENAGFTRRAPYYSTPLPDTVFLERSL